MRWMRYFVFRQQGVWAVRHGDRVCCAFSSQADAVRAAIETAQDFGDQFYGAEVLVQDEDDEFYTIWTYGEHLDPPKR